MSSLASAQIMYEIYQGNGYNGHYRVVCFTEPSDHHKESESNRAWPDATCAMVLSASGGRTNPKP